MESNLHELEMRLVRLEERTHNLLSFVRREEFEPVKRLVFGLVSLILVAVVGTLVTLVVRGGP